MDLVSLILFLLMYYIRPQEWFGFLSTFRPVQLTMILAIFALVTRERGLKLRDFFQTPHDWLMAAYLAWAIFAAPQKWDTFISIQSHIMTYVICVQALSSVGRIKTFLAWWTACIMFIATLAVASRFGFDPLGSYERTEWMMKGRLILNLSVFNNPNTLAHSVVPVLPMIFFLLYWKKIVTKVAAVALSLIPLWCIYLTMSKGAFLCAFATIVATLTFGRPKIVQIFLLILAGSTGVGALYLLPRMNELEKTRTDSAIQGRIAAFTFGRQCLSESWTGVGLSNFRQEFFRRGPLEYPEKAKRRTILVHGRTQTIILPKVGKHYYKACHSSFVQNGSELGYPGLFLFIGLMYAGLRTLLTCKTANSEEERIRRMLFVLVFSYAISSWMVDFSFRATFFLIIASVAAFHRHLRGFDRQVPETEEESPRPLLAPLRPSFTLPDGGSPPSPCLAKSSFGDTAPMQVALMPPPPPPGMSRPPTMPVPAVIQPRPVVESEDDESAHGSIQWNRFGLIDVALTLVLVKLAVRVWDHAIKNF
jgi:O-antigen ligase